MNGEGNKSDKSIQTVQKGESKEKSPYLADIADSDQQKNDFELFSKEFNVNYRMVHYPKFLAVVVAICFVLLLWKAIVMPDSSTHVVDQEKKLREYFSKNKEVYEILQTLHPGYVESVYEKPKLTPKEKALMDALEKREALRIKLMEEKEREKK